MKAVVQLSVLAGDDGQALTAAEALLRAAVGLALAGNPATLEIAPVVDEDDEGDAGDDEPPPGT